MSAIGPSCFRVHTTRPTKSPEASRLKPYGWCRSVMRKLQRSVYGSQPFVHRSTTPSGRLLTSRYTDGHQRGSPSASSRTSETSSIVPSTRHRVTKAYSLPGIVLMSVRRRWRGGSLSRREKLDQRADLVGRERAAVRRHVPAAVEDPPRQLVRAEPCTHLGQVGPALAADAGEGVAIDAPALLERLGAPGGRR